MGLGLRMTAARGWLVAFRTTGLAFGCAAVWALAGAAPVQAAPNGLDSRFGGDGKVTTDFAGIGAPDRGNAVAIQPGGKIIVAGETVVYGPHHRLENLPEYDFGLARYNSDGTLDTTFGGDGRVTTDILGDCETADTPHCGDDIAQALVLQRDGKIVVAGWTVLAAIGPGPATALAADFALARYNADGTLDTTFGGDGTISTDFSGNDPRSPERDEATSVAVQADGKIVAAGFSGKAGGGIALARYNPDGTLDTTFDDDGRVSTADGAFRDTGMAMQPNGGIVVAGTVGAFGSRDLLLARFTAAGAPDGTFGGDGEVTTDFGGNDGAGGLAIQPDGSIVAAGTAGRADGADFALARYKRDGTLDPSFSGDGKVTTDFLDADNAHAVAIEPDGTIVAAGTASARTTAAGGFALARYHADGTPDSNGGDDGKTITNFGGAATASATGMAIQPDGRIVVEGSTGFINCTCFDADFALARYKAAGSWRLDAPGHRQVYACVNDSFVDLNAVFGIPEQIVCGQRINPGEPWRPFVFWFVGNAYSAAPPGYVPAAATPLADLADKLTAVKVIVDGGTKQERTTVFSPAQALRTDVTLDRLFNDFPPFPMAVALPRMEPLKLGEHAVEVVWVLKATHCDGLGSSATDNCLPAGNASFGRQPITVARP